jgi:hypothetical protein
MANFPNGNFIPELYAKEVQRAFENSSVLPMVANRKYEGQIKRSGDTVHVRIVDNLTLGTYTKNGTISWSDLGDDKISLAIDQSKYIAFKIDDIDQAQFDIKNVLEMYGEKGGYAITDDMDSYVLGLHAGATSKIGATGTPTACGYDSGETSPIAILAQASRMLTVKNVPTNGRWGVVPPYFVEKLMDESGKAIEAQSMGDPKSIAKNGYVKRLMGFDLYESNNIASDGTYYACMFGTKEAISVAQQLTKKEMIRLETTFATGMKLLNVYGAKVMRADALCTAYLSFS